MLFTHSASFSSPTQPAGPNSAATTTTAGTPSRSSRLRRFSHLRSYNPSHLLSRDNSTSGSSCQHNPEGFGAESLTRSSNEASAAVLRSSQQTQASGSRNTNRLTLVNSAHAGSRTAAIPSSNTCTTSRASSEPAAHPQPSPVEITSAENSAPRATEPPLASESEHLQPPTSIEGLAGDSQTPAASMTRTRASTTNDSTSAAATAAGTAADLLPSIRFSAYYDPRSTRPSLTFPPVSRTLPTGTESIRVGRYSERDSHSMSNMPNGQPSAAPVGFKSKVVSRRHCEFWYEGGKWYIKDAKSSSGTFLNHIRLSPPSQESKAFPVNDGDIVQLGIDFKGGEEMIFRCVKMRIELNRGWQNKLNTFNMAAHKRLRTMANTPAAPGSTSQDCSICLNSIAPCQSLFVAPCSHTWHFKCVRALLTSPQYPIFICPNCRAGADLEADVDEAAEDWEQLEAEGVNGDKTSVNGAPLSPAPEIASEDNQNPTLQDTDAMDVTVSLNASDVAMDCGDLPHATSEPMPIRNPASGSGHAGRQDNTPSPPANGAEGPITPRNEAGPWVFDGSAGHGSGEARAAAPSAEPDSGMGSLDAAADLNLNGNDEPSDGPVP